MMTTNNSFIDDNKIQPFDAPDKHETGQDYDDEEEGEEEEDDEHYDVNETMDINGKYSPLNHNYD